MSNHRPTRLLPGYYLISSLGLAQRHLAKDPHLPLSTPNEAPMHLQYCTSERQTGWSLTSLQSRCPAAHMTLSRLPPPPEEA